MMHAFLLLLVGWGRWLVPPKRFAKRGTHRLLFFSAAFLLCLISTSPAQTDLRTSFLLEQAYGQLTSAATPPQFLAAATTYAHLTEQGYVNGPILYHTGTAYLLAGHDTEAIAYLDRAERHLGSTWEITRNRDIARQHQAAQVDSVNWRRAVFFWHYAFSYQTRLWIASLSFLCLWWILSLRALGARSMTALPLFVIWLLVIAFGSSVATTILEERESSVPIPSESTPPLQAPQ